MELISVMFLLGFGIAAWFDYTRKLLPDALTALLWGVCYFLTPIYQGWVVGFFALSLLVSSIPKKALFGWGDVLLTPIWLVAMLNVGHLIEGIVIGAIIAWMIDNAILSRERVAIAPFFFASYAMAFLLGLY